MKKSPDENPTSPGRNTLLQQRKDSNQGQKRERENVSVSQISSTKKIYIYISHVVVQVINLNEIVREIT